MYRCVYSPGTTCSSLSCLPQGPSFLPLTRREFVNAETLEAGKAAAEAVIMGEVRMKQLVKNWRVECAVYCIQKYKPLLMVLVIVVDNHDTNSAAFFSISPTCTITNPHP